MAGGGKVKPHDLFYSLKVLKDEEEKVKQDNIGVQLMQRMLGNLTNPELGRKLLGYDQDPVSIPEN